MSDVIYGGGEVEAIGSGFEGGLNKDVYLTIVFEPNVTHGSYTGPVINVTRTKNGATASDAIYPVNPDRVNTREVPVKGADGKYLKDDDGKTVRKMQTTEEAIKDAVKQLNTKLKILVTGYGVDGDAVNAVLAKKYSSFEEYAKAVLTLLPADHSTKKGSLILIYKNSGFLTLPYNAQITGRFWCADGVDKKIEVTKDPYYFGKYFTAPVQTPSTPAEAPVDPDVEW